MEKYALIAGKHAIDAERDRLRPLIDQGRYIPCVDHRVPPDVIYENDSSNLELKQRLLDL